MKRTSVVEVTRTSTSPAARPPGPTPAPAAVPVPVPVPADGAVEALRRRLAGTAARDHVVLDFLEDDLGEARAALAAVAAWVANVEAALADPAPCAERLAALSRGAGPADRVEYLGGTLASLRRRLMQVAARLG